MFEDFLFQLQGLASQALALGQNQWLVLLAGSFVFSFVVRILLGPVRGQEMSGFALAPVLAAVMIIVIGQPLFMQPAPGNVWVFSWTWRIDQLIVLFAMVGWIIGVLLDILRRPFLLAIIFGLFAAVAFSIAFVLLLRSADSTLPEIFSKTVSFGLVSAFIIWRFAQAENGYAVLRIFQLLVSAVGLLMLSLILQWTEIAALMPQLFLIVFGPAFFIAWMLWTSVGRSSNLGAVGLFGGLSPFLLFVGYQVFVSEQLNITTSAILVLILVGPDMVSGMERRGTATERVPFWSGTFYMFLVFFLYVVLLFLGGLDARS